MVMAEAWLRCELLRTGVQFGLGRRVSTDHVHQVASVKADQGDSPDGSQPDEEVIDAHHLVEGGWRDAD